MPEDNYQVSVEITGDPEIGARCGPISVKLVQDMLSTGEEPEIILHAMAAALGSLLGGCCSSPQSISANAERFAHVMLANAHRNFLANHTTQDMNS